MMRGIALLIAAAVYLSPARADEPLSLDDALREALASNPEILAAKKSHETSAARIPQASALSDPLLELEYDRIYADRELTGHTMTMYSLTQEVPFPTKLYYRAKIASRLAKMAYENYRAKERDVLARVKSAYAELALAWKGADNARENKGTLSQFSGVATSRYGAGKGTQADALKAQVELARIENELIMREQQRLTAQAKLNILLNRDPARELRIALSESPITRASSLDELYAQAKDKNPELAAYRYGIERGEAALRLSANEFMPDLMVKFKQMVRQGEPFVGGAWAGTLGVTIPLWFAQKQIFGVKEMRAELEMVKAEYRMKENMVLFDIRDAYARAEANKNVAGLYRTSFIPQAEETVNAALKGYESDKSDFLTLLDSQKMLAEFKLDGYRALVELTMALADLEKAAGTDLNTKEECAP